MKISGHNSESKLPKDTKRSRPVLKSFLVVMLVFIPILIVGVFFAPFIAGMQKQELAEYSRKYSLAPGFTHEDLRETVNSMRKDYEFQYYFRILEDESVARAVHQIYSQIHTQMDKENFRKLIDSKKTEVENLGVLFNNIEVSDDIFTTEDPNTQQLKHALWALFYEDFKLSVMGAIYKATHDPSFQFEWRVATVRSAFDLKKIFGNMRRKDIIALNRMIQQEAPSQVAR